ncbi:MAG: hypothetical protein GY797_07485 [Deltaproteobacteria bacterium]|nr:hypothetical protein [Deltaproteobacteria bacterium]
MILNYLRKNPNAGDTLEGISKWWLNLEKIDVTVDEVSEVLETLTKEGKVKRHVIDGDNPIYVLEKEER